MRKVCPAIVYGAVSVHREPDLLLEQWAATIDEQALENVGVVGFGCRCKYKPPTAKQRSMSAIADRLRRLADEIDPDGAY